MSLGPIPVLEIEPKNMIYLIGGAPRVGKTTLAQRILKEMSASWVSLDVVREMLYKAAPQLNIGAPGQWDENPDKFYPFLKEMIRETEAHGLDYTFEGDVFFPKHVIELQKEFKIKSCFLGTSNLDLKTLQDFPGLNDWLSDYPKEALELMPKWIMEKSEVFRSECEKYNLPYFDVGQDREEKLEAAFHLLTRN